MEQRKVRAQDADAEVIVRREVGVIRHLGDLVQQRGQCLLVIPPKRPQALGQISSNKVLIGVTVDLDRVVRDDAEVAWAAAEYGVEKL